ncbi:type II toxin-antitoxin system VapC family toxin [soil metagenome]
MTVPKTLLDTDILSNLMRRHPVAIGRAQTYLATYPQLTISILTRYEILRGFRARGATTQLTTFDRFCSANEGLPLTDAIIVRAADIYADLHQRGCLIGDADILIAATTLEHGLVVATNNTSHFGRVAGLSLENWLT